MSIFIEKGDAPLTASQLEKRAQKHIKLTWIAQDREKSIRTADGAFDAFMQDFSANHAVNTSNNTFNQQLKDYTKAKARLDQYIVADGRSEVIESQPTGETVFDEDTGEMTEVMADVVTVTAIEPVEPTVTQTVYSEDLEPTQETVENPLITADNLERAAAQAVVDATPDEVKAFQG